MVVDVFFSFSADITLICVKATDFEVFSLSSRYQKLDAKKNWDDMARRVVDVSTVEDFWQVPLLLSKEKFLLSLCRFITTLSQLAICKRDKTTCCSRKESAQTGLILTTRKEAGLLST